MTCIVAIAENGHVYMGGERGNSDSMCIISSTRPKVFEVGQYLIGYSGSSGIGQAICYNFTPPVLKSNKIDEHMIKEFIPALRSFFKDSEIDMPDKEEDHADILVGIKGRVYEISTADFQCIEYNEVATGSGTPYALGSLYTSKDMPAKSRVHLAIESAITYSPTCQGPIDILYK